MTCDFEHIVYHKNLRFYKEQEHNILNEDVCEAEVTEAYCLL